MQHVLSTAVDQQVWDELAAEQVLLAALLYNSKA
jgi:hypothetical protein